MLPCFTQDMLPSRHSNIHPLIQCPTPDTFTSHTPHTHIHTRTRAQPRHPSPLITHKLLPSLCSRGLMGNLLKVLACAELEHGPIVFLDFERETIRFLFFWVIPFSLLPLLCFPHSSNLSSPLFHLFVLISPFLLPQLLSSPSSLSFDFCSWDWHLKDIWLLSKGSYSYAPHLVRCRQMHNGMVTLQQNDNNEALILAHKEEK